MQVHLTEQDTKIIDYLQSHNNKNIAWEELAQFSKSPTTVKLNTIKKAVSEIKRKYSQANLAIPFNVNFISMAQKNFINNNALNKVSKITLPTNVVKHQAQLDFSPDSLGFKKVRTHTGIYQLNDTEWAMFKYFYQNPGRVIPISELRDKLCYPNFGSKLPPRWFDSIMRTINGLRRQVIGLNKRLLTVKGFETSYLFQ